MAKVHLLFVFGVIATFVGILFYGIVLKNSLLFVVALIPLGIILAVALILFFVIAYTVFESGISQLLPTCDTTFCRALASKQAEP